MCIRDRGYLRRAASGLLSPLGILDVLLSSRSRYTSALDVAPEMYASPRFLESSRRARADLMLPVRSRLLRHPSAYKQCAADFPLSIHEVAPAVDTIRRLAFSCLGARTSQLAAAYFFGSFEHLAQYSLGAYAAVEIDRRLGCVPVVTYSRATSILAHSPFY